MTDDPVPNNVVSLAERRARVSAPAPAATSPAPADPSFGDSLAAAKARSEAAAKTVADQRAEDNASVLRPYRISPPRTHK